MTSDSANKLGRIREQIEMECKSRRNYPRKWSKFYQEAPWKELYNQNEINKQLKIIMADDAHFLSEEIYKAVPPTCRCGRPCRYLHLLKCLQNHQDKSPTDAADAPTETHGNLSKLPQTSNGFVGWHRNQAHYQQWENSTKYVSPMLDMPGGRITADPSYPAILIA